MKQVLIDTDVLLDFFFDRKPYSDDSTVILSLCEQGVLEGFITPVIISNTYCLAAVNTIPCFIYLVALGL